MPKHLTQAVGGNTSCVEIRNGNEIIVLDAGSGLRNLGMELNSNSTISESDLYLAIEAGHQLKEYEQQKRYSEGHDLTLLISHTHWDHLQGFPFFSPAYQPSTTIKIYGRSAEYLSAAFKGQQTAPSMFPIALEDMGTKISYHPFPDEGLTIGSMDIQAMSMPHPGGCLAYRISAAGKTVVYATDYEFSSIDDDNAGNFVNFIKNANVLISDTQYTYLEGAAREGWGHSTSFGAMDLAMRGGVSQFFLFHHDPAHDDAKLIDNLEKTRAYHTMMSGGEKMDINLAVEGLCIEV